MSKRKNPPKEPFRRTQVVSPLPSERRYAKAKFVKKVFDVFVTDIETAVEFYGITLNAPSKAEAERIAQKRLKFSPLLRGITHAAFTAVEVKP